MLGLFHGLSAQAQFTDAFTDGDFTADPAWNGDEAVFMVNAAHQLQLNNTVAATSQLRSANAMATLADMEWRVRVKQTFSGSGSNYGRVYLVSDQADLTGALNGYYLQFGEAGSNDAIELFEQTGTASTSICRGTEAQIANSFDVGVQVKRDGAGTWQLWVDPAGGTDWTLQASGTNTTHGTSAFIGVRCTYTVSNANKFFYDDFYAGGAVVDNTAPTVLSVQAMSATLIDVRFNEALDPASATTAANYDLLPFNGIATAVLDGGDPALVHLTPGTPLINGSTYSLLITAVGDLAGNAITSSGPHNFTYLVPSVPAPGEVVINEIMADPSPVVQLPEAEFIELFNTTTDRWFDLSGWRLTTLSTQALLPAHLLGPGEYVVLVNNAQLPAFSAVPNALGWTLSNTALLNGGTTLTLEAPGNMVIDLVAYSTAWYGDDAKDDGGWTLERIDPFTPCSNAANWTASNDVRGGTPGEINSVFNATPDTQAPVMTAVQVVSPVELLALFDEPLDVATVAVATWTIDPSVAISSAEAVAPGLDQVRLVLAAELAEGVTHTLRVEHVADCRGNTAALNGPLSFTLVVPAVAAPGDVVINEIMADPSPVVQLPEAEFIELFNTTADRHFDLTGWRFTTLSAQADLPPVTLAPGAHLVLVNNAQLVHFAGMANVLGWTLSNTALLNGGTALTLEAPGGTVIDAVTYSASWYGDDVKDDGGWTLERIDPFAPCSDAANWTASTDERGGTPGTQNAVFDDTPDTTPPYLVSIQVASPTEVVLVFNEGLDAGAALSATYAIDPALTVQTVLPVNERVRLVLAAAMPEGVVHTITISGAADCSGNVLDPATGSFALPEALVAGDLVINEVLYDPVGSGSDFVELYNRSNKVLGLGGLQLANESNGAIGNFRPITSEPVILMPGAYILLATNTTDIATRYPHGRVDRFLQMALPSYNNGSGTVVLADAANNTLDLFRYADAMHFELLSSTEGTSLERVDPDRPTADNTNWHSAAQDAGRATPGYVNSQYAPAPAAQGKLTIEPAIFSPDNDGYQDLLTIAYRFEQPGFVGTMKVFDVAGREVRTLWNNELLGTEGAVSWDGTMDAGGKARIGPYIVLLEAYDLSGNVEKFRQTVTLAHRLD